MLFYKIKNKKEFVETLDFFQQKNLPIFPFIEAQLQNLTSYL